MDKSFRLAFVLAWLMALSTTMIYAQGVNVQGQVVDSFGPLAGATVTEVGTTTGTLTDFDGNFAFTASSADATISISYVGYLPVTMPASADFSKVTLSSDEKLLEDLVVIGYGSVKKNDMTGSVTAMKPDDMNKGLQVNAQDMIQGKIAGVSIISNGGAPGSGAQIRIRGGASLNASNDPLIVIDGFAMDNDGVKGLSNPLSMVNPNDIESFTVLKDASATAIYGSRASNGVILITTKKGKVGARPTISYAGNVSVSTNTEQLEVMDGNQFRAYIKNNFKDQPEVPLNLGKANTNWQDQIYRTALNHDHNITLAGGFKNTPYRLSVGYTDQQGVVKTSEMDRLTASLNLSPSLFDDHLKVNANAKAMYARNRYADGGAIATAVSMDPTQSVMGGSKYFGGYFQWTTPGAALADSDPDRLAWNALAPANPVSLLEMKDDRASSQSYIGSVDLNYKVHGFEDLSANVSLGGDYSTGVQNTNVSPLSGPNNYYGYYGVSDMTKYNLSLSAYLQYNKEIGEHNIDVMAGYEWQKFHREGLDKSYELFPSTNLNSPGEKRNDKSKPFGTESYLVSFFGRVNYTAMDRYLLTVTLRDDATSRFAKKNRWGLFPSAAFGWKLKEEAFLKDADNLDDLKLRLGWGITGQQNIFQDYAYMPTYVGNQVGAYYLFGNDLVSLMRPDAYNDKLKWEETKTYNVGADVSFLNNKITASVDAYYRLTDDLLNTVTVSAGSNFKNKVLSNVGSMENKGVELSLNYRPITTNDFSWDIGFNATYNENKITKLINGNDPDYFVSVGGISYGTGNFVQAHKVGYPASSFFVFQQVYDKEGNPIENQYVDRNADGIINIDDRYIYKKPSADVLLGLNMKATWKGWDLGFSMRASLNNYLYNDVLATNANVSNAGMWASSGFFSNRPIDAVKLGFEGKGDFMASDYFVQNASFLKMDNLTLGYSFSDLFDALNGRVYVAAQNVFTITNYTGIDPEVNSGIDRQVYPRPFVGLLGLSLTF